MLRNVLRAGIKDRPRECGECVWLCCRAVPWQLAWGLGYWHGVVAKYWSHFIYSLKNSFKSSSIFVHPRVGGLRGNSVEEGLEDQLNLPDLGSPVNRRWSSALDGQQKGEGPRGRLGISLEGRSRPVRAPQALGGMVEPLCCWYLRLCSPWQHCPPWHLVGHQSIRKSPY